MSFALHELTISGCRGSRNGIGGANRGRASGCGIGGKRKREGTTIETIAVQTFDSCWRMSVKRFDKNLSESRVPRTFSSANTKTDKYFFRYHSSPHRAIDVIDPPIP
jgi:hypothetical protein